MYCGKLFQWSLSVFGNISRCVAVGVIFSVWRISEFGKEMYLAGNRYCVLWFYFTFKKKHKAHVWVWS